MTQKNDVRQLTNQEKYRRFFGSAWAIQASWNYERQMNMGFLHGIAPILDEIYSDDIEKRKEAYNRHMEFFNITPQAASFVMGLTASMEEQMARDPESVKPEAISAIKTSLMGPLSGIGDSFFQGTVRIIAFGLGINLAQQGSILGPVIAMLISFFPSFLVTYFGGKIGYNTGVKFLTEASDGGIMDKVMKIASTVGLMVIGGMVASMVNITTPIVFNETFQLQNLFDSFFPQFISLGFTFFMYGLIKKKVKTGYILTFAIIGGIVLSYLGIFI